MTGRTRLWFSGLAVAAAGLVVAAAPAGATPAPGAAPAGLEIRSEISSDEVRAEVEGVLDHSFDAVSELLTSPAGWCEVLLLHLNTKACVHRQGGGVPSLTVYSGRKHYQPPEDARRLEYRLTERRVEVDRGQVTLWAEKGPIGTRDHRIAIEAEPAGDHTVLRLRLSYSPSAVSRAATRVYLATLGRGKTGVSVGADGKPAGGLPGILERNAVRYRLALDAHLGTRGLPEEERFEAAAREWFELTEAFPSLHEVEREDYLEAKRRERRQQVELQRDEGPAASSAAPARP